MTGWQRFPFGGYCSCAHCWDKVLQTRTFDSTLSWCSYLLFYRLTALNTSCTYWTPGSQRDCWRAHQVCSCTRLTVGSVPVSLLILLYGLPMDRDWLMQLLMLHYVALEHKKQKTGLEEEKYVSAGETLIVMQAVHSNRHRLSSLLWMVMLRGSCIIWFNI